MYTCCCVNTSKSLSLWLSMLSIFSISISMPLFNTLEEIFDSSVKYSSTNVINEFLTFNVITSEKVKNDPREHKLMSGTK
ncbi:hypothetical protein BDF21DRAFT_434847 [Thamnidium elegans]|nr:hypothetical protein BDF21DRAFT_434847 [Thamnidium elegans]